MAPFLSFQALLKFVPVFFLLRIDIGQKGLRYDAMEPPPGGGKEQDGGSPPVPAKSTSPVLLADAGSIPSVPIPGKSSSPVRGRG